MYDLYPNTDKYTGTPGAEQFQIRASAAECAKWDMTMDEEDTRNMNATMAADRIVDAERARGAASAVVHASQVSLDLRG